MSEVIDNENLGAKVPVANAGGILTMGILSIVLAGLIGLILGIIALSMAKSATDAYQANPSKYDEASYSRMNSGRICAIIGVSLSGLAILIVIGMAAG